MGFILGICWTVMTGIFLITCWKLTSYSPYSPIHTTGLLLILWLLNMYYGVVLKVRRDNAKILKQVDSIKKTF